MDLTNIREKMKSRIEARGYTIDDFEIGHFEGFKDLDDAGIEITENLINPMIDGDFLAIYASMIARNPDDENCQAYKPTLLYIHPGVNFNHANKIKQALETNNSEQLQKYIDIFTNSELSDNKKGTMANLVALNAPYEHLLNNAFTEAEAKQQLRAALATNDLLPDPLAKFSDPVRLREVYGQH